MFDFSNYSVKSKHHDSSNTLVVGKIKYEMNGAAVEVFVGLKPKMYSVLVSDSSEYKKVKGVNKNGVAKISHDEYKNSLLNNKCLRYSMNRIQSKDCRIRT